MGQVGKRLALIDGVEKVTGQMRFAADDALAGLAHAALLFSPHPHARVLLSIGVQN
jgi:CO/xanthine dehydrogenase Mo-binding subunit